MQTSPVRGLVWETAQTVIIALVIALLVRTFVLQLYVVDGSSMYPTLQSGDRLFVNKLVYRLREPRPGEVVVLRDPIVPERRLIKRVVAVGGETVEVRGGVLYVDGRPVQEGFAIPDTGPSGDVKPTLVPPGHVYVLGDNRGGSLDSRVLHAIPLRSVEGKAAFLFWPPGRIQRHGPLEAGRTLSLEGGRS